MYNMITVTLRQLRHDFASVESAAKKSPVKVTRRGRVIGTFTAAKKSARWTPPDFTARARAHFGERFTALSLLDDLAQDDAK
jgi:antitoxin (DNA-binding transcriptional repressor) of toxin-antitoxin stability system